MTRIPLLGLIAVVLASSLQAQEQDARVATPGQLRLDAAAEYLRVDSGFGENREDPWQLSGPIGAGRWDLVRETAFAYDALLAAIGGLGAGGVSGSTLAAGELKAEAVVAARTLPLRAGIGLLPRLEVGVSIPIVLTQRHIRWFEVTANGNLGSNPDPSGNAARLARFGATGSALGETDLLPVAGSPAANLLQARVAAGGATPLALPAAALTREQLTTLGFVSAPNESGSWEPGDLTVDVKFLLLSSFQGLFPPAVSGTNHRVAVSGAYRLPLDARAPARSTISTGIGYQGPSGSVIGDLFLGERYWLTAGASAWKLTKPDEDVAPPAAGGLPPGSVIELEEHADGLEVWFTPRVRITREISLGASVNARSTGVGVFIEGVDQTRTVASAGFSLRYSNLPGIAAGNVLRPLDIAVGYSRAVVGPDGAQRPSRAFLQLSLFSRIWGAGPVTATAE